MSYKESKRQAEPRLIAAKDAARSLGISPWTIYHWARLGRLPSVKLGRRRLFRPRDLEALVERGKLSP